MTPGAFRRQARYDKDAEITRLRSRQAAALKALEELRALYKEADNFTEFDARAYIRMGIDKSIAAVRAELEGE